MACTAPGAEGAATCAANESGLASCSAGLLQKGCSDGAAAAASGVGGDHMQVQRAAPGNCPAAGGGSLRGGGKRRR